MRKTFPILSVLLVLLFVSCANPASSTAPANQPGPSGVTKSAVAYDGNNVKLGYCSTNGFDIQVFSPTGYYYTLLWNGTVLPGAMSFTEADAAGTPFQTFSNPVNGKLLFKVVNQLYSFRDVDAFGNSVADETITASESFVNSDGTVQNSHSTVSPSTKAYVMETLTYSEAGIPASISLPITIKYE